MLVLYVELDKSCCPSMVTCHWWHEGKNGVEKLYNFGVYHTYANYKYCDKGVANPMKPCLKPPHVRGGQSKKWWLLVGFRF